MFFCLINAASFGSIQATWSAGSGSKYRKNKMIVTACVEDGVVELTTGEDEHEYEIGAFMHCDGLRDARLPDSLRRIGDRAFFDCKSLLRVDLPEGVASIGKEAFYSCESLLTVSLPSGLVHLPSGLFTYCSSLRSASLPKSLKSIGNWAFDYCSHLESINFDDLSGLTKVGWGAFSHCSSLTTFNLPPGLKTIEGGTFSYCSSLSSVKLPPRVETIQKFAFFNCHPSLSLDLPETLTTVNREALSGCSVRLPSSISSLASSPSVTCALQGVKSVVVSSRVDLPRLVDLITFLLPLRDAHARSYVEKDVTFRVLYSDGPSASSPPPGIASHVHESFFSVPLSLPSLLAHPSTSLHDMARNKFLSSMSLYASLLHCGPVDLPKEILYAVLPYAHGETLTKSMLKDIVNGVGKVAAVEEKNQAQALEEGHCATLERRKRRVNDDIFRPFEDDVTTDKKRWRN